MKDIKAVFFDIDGTLVSFDTHTIPASTIEAISILRAKGIKTFIATGRPKTIVNNLGDIPFDGYVTLNGGVCFLNGEIVYERTIPQEDINALIDYNKTHDRYSCIYVVEDKMILTDRQPIVNDVMKLLNIKMPIEGDADDIRGRKVYQVLGFFPVEEETRIMSVMPGSETTRWTDSFADIIPRNSCKSVGISHIIEKMNITPDECMAFGDGGNDMGMLQYVGTGIAMGNASPSVKSVSDYVTDDIDADGIYKALKHFSLI